MLSKQYRIPKTEIPHVVRRGKRSHIRTKDTNLVTISRWFHDELEHPRFAFIVSKEIDKRAVVRNRIKRRLRAIIYHILQEGKLRTGDYALLVKSVDVAEMDFEELKLLVEQNI